MMPNKLTTAVVALLAMFALSASAHANLMANGSFESNFSDWTVSGNVGTTSTQGATNGTLAASFGGGDGPDNGVLSQIISSSVGTSYSFQFDYGAFADTVGLGHSQALRIEIIGNSSLVDEVVTDSGTTPTTFKALSRNFIVDASSLTVRFSDESNTTQAIDMVLDNVQLNAVPEPASLALLGLGGLALLSRRRRRV